MPSGPLAQYDAQARDAAEYAPDVPANVAEAAVDAAARDAQAAAPTHDADEFDGGAFDATSPADAQLARDASPAVPCFADSPASANGVRIHVEGDRCSFPYGTGGTFRYRVTLERAIPYRVAAGNSCGYCMQLGSNVKPLTRVMVVAIGDGGFTSYCADCDVGCCPPNREASYELSTQIYEGTLDWPARSFNGPSDTGQKPGAFFPRGPAHVLIMVSLPGAMEAAATAKLPITIE